MATITTQRRPLSRYRARVTARNRPPIPEQWLPVAVFREPPPLWQFVFLSMLLHTMFIALFGAPSGGSADGRAMWGSMQVELRGLLVEPTAPPPVAAAPVEALRRGYVPPAPTRQDRGASEGAVPFTPPAETQAAATAPLGPAIVEVPTPFPRVIDRLPTSEVRLAEPPPLRVPPPTEGRDLRPPPRERIEATPAEIPLPIPITPSTSTERALAEPPPVEIPLAQPLPLPSPAPAPIPQPAERAAPLAAPETRPAERAPVEVVAIPVPQLESVAPTTGGTAAPIEMAPLPPIEAVPAAPPMQPAVQAAPSAQAPEPETSAPRFTAPGLAPGTQRRPGTRAGESASDYDPTAPSLDAEALRARAGRIAREGSGQSALLPFPMPPVPAKKSPVEAAIENARKPDCRTAYQGLGLLAVVPLVANEFGEGNCRWTR